MLFVSILYLYSGLAGGDHLGVDPTESNSPHFAQALQMVIGCTLRKLCRFLSLGFANRDSTVFARPVISRFETVIVLHQSDAAAI